MRAVTAAAIGAGDPSEIAAKEAEVQANLAMEWLQKAIAAGYKNSAYVAHDKDLNSLRQCDDFKALLAALKATANRDRN
jgi:hypothetical protein